MHTDNACFLCHVLLIAYTFEGMRLTVTPVDQIRENDSFLREAEDTKTSSSDGVIVDRTRVRDNLGVLEQDHSA